MEGNVKIEYVRKGARRNAKEEIYITDIQDEDCESRNTVEAFVSNVPIY